MLVDRRSSFSFPSPKVGQDLKRRVGSHATQEVPIWPLICPLHSSLPLRCVLDQALHRAAHACKVLENINSIPSDLADAWTFIHASAQAVLQMTPGTINMDAMVCAAARPILSHL